MTDQVEETANHITLAVRDSVFDPENLTRWIAGRAKNDPELLACVVMRLASWCPPDPETRYENACQVLRERGMAGAIPVQCERCKELMVTRTYRQPHLKVVEARGLCTDCYRRQWNAQQKKVAAAS